MKDGYWRIQQFAPNTREGFTVTTINVRPNPNATDPEIASPTFPWWLHEDMNVGPCLVLVWEDGREEYFPWASIVHAEYQPPTHE